MPKLHEETSKEAKCEIGGSNIKKAQVIIPARNRLYFLSGLLGTHIKLTGMDDIVWYENEQCVTITVEGLQGVDWCNFKKRCIEADLICIESVD